MTTAAWVTFQRNASALRIEGGGEWRATAIAEVEQTLSRLEMSSVTSCLLDVRALTSLDTTGAWIIRKLLSRLNSHNVEVSIEGEKESFIHLLEHLSQYEVKTPEDKPRRNSFLRLLERLGEETLNGGRNIYEILVFLGLTIVKLGYVFLHPLRLRLVSIVATLHRAGIDAIPIVSLIAFLMGIVLVYQSIDQLRLYGAEIFTVNLLGVSILREIGILLAAIMVAGRSGSAITAQIGTMKLNQEIDAMVTLGIDPIETLVIPRVISLVIALPLLAFLADIVGLFGGALMCRWVIDMNFYVFLERLQGAIHPWTFWVGIIKAPIFGFVIALVSCFEGMRVSGGAESIGRQTTRAVVESIFLVLVFDAAFSVFFSYLRI